MSLTAVSCRNFKCFADLRLRLAPLTFLTGFNAAGKSTSIQPLLLLSQGLRQSHALDVIPLNGPLARLGSISDVLHSETLKIPLTIGVESGPHYISVTAVGSEDNRSLKILSSDRSSAENDGVQSTDIVATVSKTTHLGVSRGQLGVEAMPTPDVLLPFADVGSSGEFAAWAFERSASDDVPKSRQHQNEKRLTIRRQVEAYMGDLFSGFGVDVQPVPRTSLTTIFFRTKTTGDWLRPSNTGFGISYAFPIILLLLTASAGQVLVIDSPEAHLHPKAQSEMGKILAKVAASGVQILVETHSEHVVNGARLAVRAGTLTSEDIALHFFGGSTEGSHGISSPSVDRNGMIDYWPRGFFDQTEIELMELSGFDA